MKQFFTTTILLTTGLICYANSEKITKRMHRVDFSQVFIDDAFGLLDSKTMQKKLYASVLTK